jgi:hypothetical protein
MTWYKFPRGRVLHMMRDTAGRIAPSTLITSACGSVVVAAGGLIRPYQPRFMRYSRCKRCESMTVKTVEIAP